MTEARAIHEGTSGAAVPAQGALMADAGHRQLRWRCRRGMRELDVLFERYFDRRYAAAPEAEQAAFRALMDCEDTDVWSWCVGREQPASAELGAIVARMAEPPAGVSAS